MEISIAPNSRQTGCLSKLPVVFLVTICLCLSLSCTKSSINSPTPSYFDIRQWNEISGPAGGVTAIVARGSTLFAGTLTGGVFLSTNGGTNWVQLTVGLSMKTLADGSSLYAPVVALAEVRSYVVAGTAGYGVFVSSNGGASWNAKNVGLSNLNIYALAAQGDTIFAGSEGSGVFVSSDFGGSWTPLATGFPVYTQSGTPFLAPIYAMAECNGNLLVGSTSGIHILEGGRFTRSNTGLTDTSISSLAVRGVSVLAGTRNGSVFLSTDGGRNWASVGNDLRQEGVTSVAITSQSLLATTNKGVYRSVDQGAHWASAMSFRPYQPGYATALTIYGQTLLAAIGGTVHSSTDDGQHWNPTHPAEPVNIVTTMRISSSGAYVFAGTASSGVYRSSDDGLTWQPANNGLSNLAITDLCTDDRDLYAVAFDPTLTNPGGVFRSTDFGRSWTSVNSGLTSTSVTRISADNGQIAAGANNGDVFLSTNRGESWSNIGAGLPKFAIVGIAKLGNTIFVGGYGLFKTTDNGTSWSDMVPQNSTINVTSLVVQDGEVYIGTLFSYSGTQLGSVGILTDSARNQNSYTTIPPLGAVYGIAVSGTSVYASTQAGVFVSIDNRATWTEINSGFSTLKVNSIAIDNGFLFAAGSGVWRRPVGSAVF